MPMNLSKAVSPKGQTYCRIHSFGEVTPADAEAASKHWAAGGEFYDLPMVALVDSGAKFSPEARQVFTKSGGASGEQKPVAVIVTNAPLRVMLSFIIRASGAAPQTKFFGTEAEAIAFIDEKA
jgi:hypothetical protein